MTPPTMKQDRATAPADPQVKLAVEELMDRPIQSVVDIEEEQEVNDLFAREAIEIFKKGLKGE